MAELEEVVGKVSGSDSISDFPCFSCDKNNKQVEASWRCVDCRANLCEHCLIQHNNFVLTGSHKVLTKQQARDTQGHNPADTVIRKTCRIHTNQVVAQYCGNHDVLCCGICSTNHKTCQQLKSIPDAASAINPQKALEKVTLKVNLVTHQLKHLKQTRQESLDQLDKDKAGIHEELSNFRERVTEKLDQIEDKAKAEVEDKYFQLRLHIENDIARLDSLILSIDETTRDIAELIGDNATEKFVSIKDAEGQIAASKAFTNEVDALEGTEKLEFVLSTEVEDYFRILETLGSVTDFFSLSVTLLDRPNVKAKTDGNCDIYDCCLMDGGSVVLTDVANKTLKLLDRSYALVDQLKMPCRPCGVCQVAKDQVAVAMLDDHMIQFADIAGKITTTGTTITVGKPCRGIISCRDRLFVTCGGGGDAGGSGQVRIYSRLGDLLHTIEKDSEGKDLFSMPLHIDVSPDGNQIAVANRMEGVVVLDSNGEHKWSFSHPDLKHVVGVCHVDAATVLVSGYKSSNVFQLGPDGKMYSELLSNPVGMPSFYSLSYDYENKRLIVSGRSSELAVYQAYRGKQLTFPSGSAV